MNEVIERAARKLAARRFTYGSFSGELSNKPMDWDCLMDYQRRGCICDVIDVIGTLLHPDIEVIRTGQHCHANLDNDGPISDPFVYGEIFDAMINTILKEETKND